MTDNKNETLANATTPEQASEVDYGQHVIWRLVNSTIVSFGANERGEIYLSTNRGDEFLFGMDPDDPGSVAIFEVEKKASSQ